MLIVMASTTEGFTMKDPIGYLRVSTKKQGRSGLGLATQRLEIAIFAARGILSQVLASGHSDRCGEGPATHAAPGLTSALKDACVTVFDQ